jgi:T5orf172 domain
MPKSGKIYILRNPYLQDSLVKVGKTSRISEVRAKELSAATGVPGPFEVLYEQDVFDTDLAERLAHEALDKFRVNPQREFFRVPLKIAVREVFSISKKLEDIQKGYADPQVVILMNAAANAMLLKSLLEPYLGGDTLVSVVFKGPNAIAEFDLGEDWRIYFSREFVRDLKMFCEAVGTLWQWNPRIKKCEEFDLKDDIPF